MRQIYFNRALGYRQPMKAAQIPNPDSPKNDKVIFKRSCLFCGSLCSNSYAAKVTSCLRVTNHASKPEASMESMYRTHEAPSKSESLVRIAKITISPPAPEEVSGTHTGLRPQQQKTGMRSGRWALDVFAATKGSLVIVKESILWKHKESRALKWHLPKPSSSSRMCQNSLLKGSSRHLPPKMLIHKYHFVALQLVTLANNGALRTQLERNADEPTGSSIKPTFGTPSLTSS